MAIDQVSVFIENQPGRLAEILAFLAAEQVDIRAFSVAETSDFGILRMIPRDAALALSALKSRGFTAKKTGVVGAVVPDRPGASVAPIQLLSAAGINIEYTYAFALPAVKRAFVLLRVEDNDAAETLFRTHGIQIADSETFF